MMDRVAHTAGTALGYLLLLGVVAKLAPQAIREAKEVAAEYAGSVRHLLKRRPRGGGNSDLARQIRALTPAGTSPVAGQQDLLRQVQDLKPATMRW